MRFQSFLLILVSVFAFSAIASESENVEEKRSAENKPNIVIIAADDLVNKL